MQTTDTIFMVRPFSFRSNEETAVNNFFQSQEVNQDNIADLALAEFDNFTRLLKSAGIKIITLQDQGLKNTPDSIFPNNVISFQPNQVILYPMFAKNRRLERSLNYLGQLENLGYHFDKVIDYSIYEDQNKFLEGTGVLILDHTYRIAYCAISDRSNLELLNIYCEDQQYKPISFHAGQTVHGKLLPIYHSNVMMSIGTNFCLICMETIKSEDEKNMLLQSFSNTRKEVIEISENQMNHFAGNILEVKNREQEPIICMSTQAFESLNEEQIKQLEKFGAILHAPLYTIEKYGGGSARCMMAELFHQ